MRLGPSRNDSNRPLKSVVCLLCLLCIFCSVFFDCQSFKLFLHHGAYIRFLPKAIIRCRTLPISNFLFFRVRLLCPFWLSLSLPIISNSVFGGSPQYQTLAQSFVHRRKRKSKQQRCSSNSSTTRSMTYLTSTSMWNPRAPMATKRFHFPAATLTNCSHSTHCQVTVALFHRQLFPPPISGPVSLLSPGVLLLKTSGVCRKRPVLRHLRPSIRAPFLSMTLSNLLLFLI